VLDCWFESGSMPYAQIHYPFENQERFERRFPADYIAEGLDQTRGWFYTLLVLSTALFDEAPFRNCVVNGMILAEDGRKMSKRLKNYPSPIGVVDTYGADALRAYLINSPLVRGEPIRFSENGVRDVVRTVLLPYWNAYHFFTTYARADGLTRQDLETAPLLADRPEIDRWIVSVLQSLVRDVNREMEDYKLYAVVPPILGFIDDLTNWYIRRSRRRFWSERAVGDDEDKLAAFATLYEVLVTFSQVAAPILPFITEDIFGGLTGHATDSVHLTDYPSADDTAIDSRLEDSMHVVRTVVNLGRGLRKQHDLRVRQPLASLTVITRDASVVAAVESHHDLIAEELNLKAVTTTPDERGLVVLSAKPNFKVLGPRFGSRMREATEAIALLDHETLVSILGGADVTLPDDLGSVGQDDLAIDRAPMPGVVVASDGPIAVGLDTDLSDELRAEGLARDLISLVQGMRRDARLAVTDRISITWDSDSDEVAHVFAAHGSLIAAEVLAASIGRAAGTGTSATLGGHEVQMRVEKL
ncbi:MAG: class I tRNA ligase family protein, partial [Acidimicrobiia bacterium]|nr:class I tRNA ligase family protein [Acidimicrobiia bacterium]